MQERAVKKNQVLEIVISDMAFGGVGIGKLQTEQGEFAVFVQNAIPGQRVLARVEKAQKRFAECKLVEVLNPSPDEVEVPYQAIPGAPYATLPIELQRQYKRRTTLEVRLPTSKKCSMNTLNPLPLGTTAIRWNTLSPSSVSIWRRKRNTMISDLALSTVARGGVLKI